MMPSVLPRISKEFLADFSHSPRCAEAFFCGMPRISRMASASTSSATLRVLEKGALKTTMPRSVAAGRLTWLVPMQKQPTAIRRGALSSTSSVSWVRERIPTMCVRCSLAFSSSSGNAVFSASICV